ncbi:MAG: IS4 family transposase, partial [Azoarcus sp.]|nr:IS4 family transposase [Azoarcus sp.]
MSLDTACWAESEFADLELGDKRLNKRARLLMERLSSQPTAGVPQACRGWSETMAAYRFFGNDDLEWEAILEPHWRQTEQRMASHPV